MHCRRGLTLIELLVVLTIMAVGAGVVMISMPAVAGRADHGAEDAALQIAAARDSALRSGQPVTVAVRDSMGVFLATAWPDGSVIGSPELGVTQFTGR